MNGSAPRETYQTSTPEHLGLQPPDLRHPSPKPRLRPALVPWRPTTQLQSGGSAASSLREISIWPPQSSDHRFPHHYRCAAYRDGVGRLRVVEGGSDDEVR